MACVVLASGCTFFLPGYRLTASVEGVVSRADIHEVAGNFYANHSETHFWANFADEHGRLLKVRLSTDKDFVSFSNKMSLRIRVEWRFCDKRLQEEVRLGGPRPFLNGAEIGRRHPPPAADHQGRYRYDAILYVRDARPAEHRWLHGRKDTEVLMEGFDLGREPRDVCVRLELPSHLDSYRTNFARIPKEHIAAALGGNSRGAPAAKAQQ